MLVSNIAESFLYQKLQHEENFRLLKLTRSSSADEWKGVLVEIQKPTDPPTVDTPKYYALSYCWGQPTFNVPERHSIEISLSLSSALAHILHCTVERSIVNIWIDQICINQRDDTEKEQQIRIMWRIYEGAEEDIGWLGPSFDGSEQALAELILFAGPSDENPSEEWEKVARQAVGKLELDVVTEHLGQIMIPGSDLRKRMLSLFERPWFTRRWIAQEACLARKLRICCGFQCISGEQLFRALKAIQGMLIDVVSPWLKKPFRKAFALLHAKHVVHGLRPPSFPHLLQSLSFLDCEKEQDRVNALFGIVRSNTWFKPEYCPAPDLYVKFAIGHLRKFQSLEILHFAGVTDPARHGFHVEWGQKSFTIASAAEDLPSWVPDWRVESRPIPILSAGSYTSDQRRGEVPCRILLDAPHRIITLKGKLLSAKIKPCGIPHLDRFKPVEDSRYTLTVDNWCNQFFVNFLPELDRFLAHHYRRSPSFLQWHQSLVEANKDPSDLLLPFARTLIMNGMVKSAEEPKRFVPKDKILEYFLEYANLHLVADSCAGSLALEAMNNDYASMEKAAAYGYLAEEVCRYRTLLVGNDHIVGLGVPGIVPGDRVCFFSGLQTPFILHPQKGFFQLRGECYVDGLMNISYDDLEELEQDIVLK